jgi:adenosylcobinamide-phosphate synthase
VAENMVDGITAPLFFAISAGFVSSFLNISPIGCSAVGAYFYKSVNTLDSMIGYKNKTYLNFGRVAAQLDDLVNFIPARISSICLIMAAFFLKLDYRGATRIFFRDRLQHSSPNAGHPEAVVAGALGVKLGGPSIYFGEIVDKPFMGESLQKISPDDILRTHRLAIVGALIFIVLMMSLYGAANMF